MMTKEQLEALTNDPEFVAAANACRTEEEAVALFKEYGIEIDSWEEFKKEFASLVSTMDVPEGELSDEELAAVQGGAKLAWGLCIGIGISSQGLMGPIGCDTYCVIIGVFANR